MLCAMSGRSRTSGGRPHFETPFQVGPEFTPRPTTASTSTACNGSESSDGLSWPQASSRGRSRRRAEAAAAAIHVRPPRARSGGVPWLLASLKVHSFRVSTKQLIEMAEDNFRQLELTCDRSEKAEVVRVASCTVANTLTGGVANFQFSCGGIPIAILHGACDPLGGYVPA